MANGGIVGPIGSSIDKDKNGGMLDAVDDLRDARIAAYAIAAGWTGDKAVTAVAIALGESSGNPGAVNKNSNGSEDFGLWQVNSIHKPTEAEKFNGAANARKAHAIYAEAGNSFKPWVVYNTGKWKTHQSAAKKAVDTANKKGSQWIKEAAASSATVDKTADAIKVGIPNPLDGIGKTIGKAVNNFVAVLIALVFIVLAIVILARGAATRVGSGFVKEFVGNQAKTAKANAPAPTPKPVLSVEEKARKAVEYSEARKAIVAEMDAAKAAESLAELKRKLGKK